MTVSICIIFIIGYCLIAFESFFKINKAAIALVSGVLCWTLLAFFSPDNSFVPDALSSHIAQIAGILFFLLGAMTIVELIDAHDGFDIITNQITNNDKRKLLWLVAFITFFLSALLDNLTTAIVIITLLRKLIRNENDRLFFAGIVIVAANAGGAWSPIGDVTTTMLWIGGQISPLNIILKLFLPSLVCLLTPLIFLSFTLKGNIQRPLASELKTASPVSGMHQQIIFFFRNPNSFSRSRFQITYSSSSVYGYPHRSWFTLDYYRNPSHQKKRTTQNYFLRASSLAKNRHS